uniref:Uncharacterized protein n=1 Tax=Romanomermis culicivorax TaxID=13658 RepID=A0A915ISH9_ROMCU
MKPITLTVVLNALSDLCSKSKNHRGYVKLEDLVNRILADRGCRSDDDRELSSETIFQLLHEGNRHDLCHYLGRDRWKFGAKRIHDQKHTVEHHVRKMKTQNYSNHDEMEKKRKKGKNHKKEISGETLLKQLISMQHDLLKSSKSEEENSNRSKADYKFTNRAVTFSDGKKVGKSSTSTAEKETRYEKVKSTADNEGNQLIFVEPAKHENGQDAVCVECGQQVDREAKTLFVDQYTLPQLLQFLSEIDDKKKLDTLQRIFACITLAHKPRGQFQQG